MTAPYHAAEPGAPFSSYADFYQNSAYAAFPQEHFAGGSFGLRSMRVKQDPIDFIDSPVPEIVFCRALTPGRNMLIDLGDGASEVRYTGGEFTVYPAYSAPRTRVSDAHEISVISLPCAISDRLMEQAGLSPGEAPFHRFLGRTGFAPVAGRLMDRVWDLLQHPTAINHLLLDGLTLQFLAEMADASDLSPLGGARPEDKRIARVLDYVEAHFGDQLNIDELAGVACLSPAHFSRVFKATVGLPVWSYVQQRRCVRAKEMLIGTRMPLIEVAFRCGFSSQAHFTRSFKSQFGITPGQARSDVE